MTRRPRTQERLHPSRGHATERLRPGACATAARTVLLTAATAALAVTAAFLGGLIFETAPAATAAVPAIAGPTPRLPPIGPLPPIRTLTPIASGASEKIRLRAGFTPFRLGASTTITFSFRIKSPKGTVPQPLIGIALALPEGLGAATSGLGLATCAPRTFLEGGVNGCPPNSMLGRATATATVPIGPEVLSERVRVALAAAASKSGRLEILYGAEGVTPVFAQLVFRGEILEAEPPYGEEINTFIPPIETLPEAPYAAVVSMSSTIGPEHLTYYRQVHGRRVAFDPEGVELPRRCPRGGFRFAATFTFLDGAAKTLRETVACPRAPRRRAA